MLLKKTKKIKPFKASTSEATKIKVVAINVDAGEFLHGKGRRVIAVIVCSKNF
jgi:hypothetical protein